MKRQQSGSGSFEDSIVRLEKIVAQLQSGDLPLDRALELFEEGVGLSRQCQAQLEVAERKVELLLREKGELRLTPFESPTSGAGGRSSAESDLPATDFATASDSSEEDDDDDDDDDLPF
jgi:exodeoxyribonuclease VII small subunit